MTDERLDGILQLANTPAQTVWAQEYFIELARVDLKELVAYVRKLKKEFEYLQEHIRELK